MALVAALAGWLLLLAPLPATAASTATLLQTVDTSSWSPASPDPSGLEYLPAPHDRLVVSDGEVDETTGAGWQGVNVWFADLASPQATPAEVLNTRVASPTNNEPVGVAYDPSADELYVGRDGANSRVWVYRPGSDAAFGTPDDVQVRSFAISSLGVADGEGLAFGDGRLWVADGKAKEVWWFGPGLDGTIGTADDTSGHWDTAALGQSDPEGIDHDPQTGNLWLVSKSSTSALAEVTTAGALVRTVSISSLGALNPSGIAVAPSSSGTGMSVWVADRGVDNTSDPAENDGRLYELSITEAPPPGPGTNLLSNGGFEEADGSGRPTGWTSDARFTRDATVVQAGAFAGRHAATGDAAYKVTQDVVVGGGLTYAVGGFVSVPATPDAFKLLIKVQWRAAGALATVTAAKFTKATNGYVAWSADLTAPPGATTARVMMVLSSLGTTLYVDDFSFAVK
jgi:hypothetical protein